MQRKVDITSKLRPSQARLYRLLGSEPPKPVHPVLARIYGFPLAIIINQLLFWDGLGSNKQGYIFKTEMDFLKECGLSSAHQKGAIKKGKKYGFLQVDIKGNPGKRHYLLDFDMLVECTVQEAKSKSINLTKGLFDAGEKRLSLTERTQETTTKRTSGNSIGNIIDKRYGKR